MDNRKTDINNTQQNHVTCRKSCWKVVARNLHLCVLSILQRYQFYCWLSLIFFFSVSCSFLLTSFCWLKLVKLESSAVKPCFVAIAIKLRHSRRKWERRVESNVVYRVVTLRRSPSGALRPTEFTGTIKRVRRLSPDADFTRSLSAPSHEKRLYYKEDFLQLLHGFRIRIVAPVLPIFYC